MFGFRFQRIVTFCAGHSIPCSCYTARRNWLFLLILKSRARPGVFAQLLKGFGDGNTSGYTFWFKLTVLEWTSRHDPHMTCDGMSMWCYRSIEYIDFQRGHTPLELTPLELSTHGKEIFIMIIGGLDVCDAFKFHRDEDTEFLNYKRGGQGLIGRRGAKGEGRLTTIVV